MRPAGFVHERRWLVLLPILAGVGVALCLWLFPWIHPSGSWGVEIDRAAAIEEARAMGQSLGLELGEWRPQVASRYLRNDEFLLRTAAQREHSNGTPLVPAPILEFFSPVIFEVQLTDPVTNQQILIDLTRRGTLRRFYAAPLSPARSLPTREQGVPGNSSRNAPLASDEPDDSAPLITLSRQEETARITRAYSLLTLLLPQLQQLQVTLSEASYTREITRLRYRVLGEEEWVSPVWTVVMRGEQLERIEFSPGFSPSFRGEAELRQGEWARWLSQVDGVYMWVVLLIGIISFLGSAALGRLQPRLTLLFWAASFVFLLSFNWGGAGLDRIQRALEGSGLEIWLERVLQWGLYGVTMLGISFLLFVIFSTGLAISLKVPRRRTIGFELLLKGSWRTKPVTGSLLTGLSLGGLIAALPLAIAASGWIPGIELDALGRNEDLTGRAPALAAAVSVRCLLYFILFGLLAPLLQAWIRGRITVRVVLILLSTFILFGVNHVYLPAAGIVWVSLLLGSLLTFLYFRIGLLGLTVATLTAEAVTAANVLLSQPNPMLQRSGWSILTVVALGIGSTWLIYWRSRPVRAEELAIPPRLLETRAERDRLQAEFAVARRAQEKLLPAASPVLPGFQFAAVCLPSREVGGDLYDFLPFADGRLAIVVADVSGKGVPASLYMTLTKGLLNSLAEETTDPGKMLREINRHLYDVCRRKVFVTLFLGILDPARKTLEYARAGHNPTIHLDGRTGRTTQLESRGMGLGMVGSGIFDPTLVVETLSLSSGDTLLFYSDGITEAMNRKDEEYGLERLLPFVRQHASTKSAIQLRDAILADVRKFLGPDPPQDDQTLVIVKVE